MKEIAEDTTSQQGEGNISGSGFFPSHDEIAEVAFSLYESRGRRDGHHVEDWLHAEEELQRRYE
jgi:hypothetical protein